MEMDDDDQYYDDEYYDDEVEEVVEEPRNTYAPQPKKTAPAPKRTGLVGIGDGPEVLVLDPERFEDAPGIVNKIKADKTVVVNLKNTEYEDGQKIFDFLNGAVFALEGSINRIACLLYTSFTGNGWCQENRECYGVFMLIFQGIPLNFALGRCV